MRQVTWFGLVMALSAGAALAMDCLQQKVPVFSATPGEGHIYSASLAEGVALVGTPQDEHAGLQSGAAYVLAHEGGRWSESARLIASDAGPRSYFGGDVSLSGPVALIGAMWDGAGGRESGAAYVFRFNGSSWVEEAKLKASEVLANAYFGEDVAVDGDLAMVRGAGAPSPGESVGALHVFEFDGTAWTQVQRLFPEDVDAGWGFTGGVALRGDVAVVGGDDNSDTGAVYVLRREAGSWRQTAKLQASDGSPGDFFGLDVDLSDERVLVGAFRAGENSDERGAAYVFHWDGTAWLQEAKLVDSSGGHHQDFGRSVSLSDGTALVGAPRSGEEPEDSGTAFLYGFDGVAWSEDRKYTARDPGREHGFGWAVDHRAGVSLVAAKFASASYFFDCDPEACTSNADCDDGIVCTLDTCELSSGDCETVIEASGSPCDDGVPCTDSDVCLGAGECEGRFKGCDDGLPCTADACITATGDCVNQPRAVGTTCDDGDACTSEDACAALGDCVGRVTHCDDGLPCTEDACDPGSGDCAHVAVAIGSACDDGVPCTTDDACAADATCVGIVKTCDDGSSCTDDVCDEETGECRHALITCDLSLEQTALPDAAGGEEQYGASVSIAEDTALIGARGDDERGVDAGAVHVMRRLGEAWVQEAKLFAGDATADNQFGSGVAVSGDVAVIGSVGDWRNGFHSGSAYIFRRVAGLWVEEAKLLEADGGRMHRFGHAVAVQGDVVLVSSLGAREGQGAVYAYYFDGAAWIRGASLEAPDGEANDLYGYRVALHGTVAAVAASLEDDGATNAGSVHVFRRQGFLWSHEAELLPSDPTEGGQFGAAVSVFDGRLVVGADGALNGTERTGAAYVFSHDGTAWSQEAKLVASDVAASSSFGASVSLSDRKLLVGDPAEDLHRGSATLFVNDGGTWIEQVKHVADDSAPFEVFGWSVALSGSVSLVGRPDYKLDGTAVGAAHFLACASCDSDLDGVEDILDNCVTVVNASQRDSDQDGLGDACEACPHDAANVDSDDDGVCDDGDGSGLAGDNPCPDGGSDGIYPGCDDNCRSFADETQSDADGDGTGDACDFTWCDVAPRGAPDGSVDVSDVIVMLRMAVGLEAISQDEMNRANVMPAVVEPGSPEVLTPTLEEPREINVADTIVALRLSVGLTAVRDPV